MSERMRRMVVVSVMAVAFVGAGSAQDQVRPYRGVTSFADYLKAHGITTRPALIAALTDHDPTVRRIAAHRLAETRDPEGAILLGRALKVEEDPSVQVDTASALWSLDVPEGATWLASTCENLGVTDEVAVKATRQLAFRSVGGNCVPRLIDILSKTHGLSQRVVMLSVLSQVAANAPAATESIMLKAANDSLQDPAIELRLAGTDLLERINTDATRQMLSLAAQGRASRW